MFKTIRLEIKDASGTWVLDIHSDNKYSLSYQEVSTGEAKWRCMVADGRVEDDIANLCNEHGHLVPVEVLDSMQRVLEMLIKGAEKHGTVKKS